MANGIRKNSFGLGYVWLLIGSCLRSQKSSQTPQLSCPVKLAGSPTEVHIGADQHGSSVASGPGPTHRKNMEREPEMEVTLREFTEADAEALFSWASDERVVRFQRREAYSRVDEARRYILDHILPHPWYRAICVGSGAGAVVVGSISVKPGPDAAAPRRSSSSRRASLGYRLARGYWGRGIATRAVRVAAAAAFAEWPWLARLEAVADAENPASQRVLEKAGFVREGVLRSYVVLKGRPRDMVMFSSVDTDRQSEPVEAHGLY